MIYRTATRQRLLAALVSVLLGAGFLAVSVIEPAEANHGNRTLEVSPEVPPASPPPAGNNVRFTANLRTVPPGGEPAPEPGINIDFEIETGPADPDGNTPRTPDETCTVEQGATSCSVDITAPVPGTSQIRAWIDHDMSNTRITEADPTEGRLSAQVIDCQTEPAGAQQACNAGTPVPGATQEPDLTDVVEMRWVEPPVAPTGLDCDDTGGGDDVERNPRGEGEVYRCTLIGFDSEGEATPIPNRLIDAENLDGANDPDDSAAPGTPDYPDFCRTGPDGSCTATIPAQELQIGPADICFWMDETGNGDNVYDPGAVEQDGGLCDEEFVPSENDFNNTDLVTISWEDPEPSDVEARPSEGRNTLGNAQTVRATVFDQFGTPWTATPQTVLFEFFQGSPADAEFPEPGNTPEGADRGCQTAPASHPEEAPAVEKASCSFDYTVSSTGQDRLCGWIITSEENEPPVMEGDNFTGTCDGENVVADTKPRVDVITVTWTEPVPPDGGGGGGGGGGTTATPGGGGGQQAGAAQGYALVASDGGIFNFGSSKFHGSTGSLRLNQPIVGMAYTSTGNGYWLVASDGGIFAFGDAVFRGSTGSIKLNQPIVGMERTSTDRGYWLVASDGGIFAFGDAIFRGSTGSIRLNRPITGMAATATDNGYWMVATDGGMFAFGDARFHGSTGGQAIPAPIVGMAESPTDNGYWLAGADGRVYAFGDSVHRGQMSGRLNQPVVGIDSTNSGNGYWMVATDGGIFSFGDAQFQGSTGSLRLNRPIVGIGTVPV